MASRIDCLEVSYLLRGGANDGGPPGSLWTFGGANAGTGPGTSFMPMAEALMEAGEE